MNRWISFACAAVWCATLWGCEGKPSTQPEHASLQDLARIPLPNIVIQEGQTVEITGDAEVGLVHVKGTVRCKQGVHATIRLQGLLLDGPKARFECGTPTQPFNGKLVLQLTDHRELSELLTNPKHPFGGKAIVAMMGATISWHGAPKSGHTRLDAHLHPGEGALLLEEPVNWVDGDELVVTTTSFYPDRSERLTLDSAADPTMLHTSPARYFHYGHRQHYTDPVDGDAFMLDERAYVANLTRHIVIESERDGHTADKTGAHVMVMHGGKAYVDSVEFRRVGQMGKMGRYPFHWHRSGDVKGQYIRRSSIHESFSRCVTVHNTNYAEVTDNVCYDHYGHGYFLEDGNEIKNVLRGNLGIFSRKPPAKRALLTSDINDHPADRFPGPATYWISNPDNDIRGNVAAGSEGSGFWMAFNRELDCPNGKRCVVPTGGRRGNVKPLTTDTLEFSDNVAHSTVCGITWDGAPDGPLTNERVNPNDRELVMAHYSPQTIPYFADLVMYKNSRAGVYFRGEQAHFPRSIFADNGTSAFFAYNQVVSDALVVGISDNHNAEEQFFHYDPKVPHQRRWTARFEGIRVYDGPFVLDNVLFADFPSTPVADERGNDITPTPITLTGASIRYGNVTRRLSFSPEPLRRYWQLAKPGATGINWQDSYTASLTDEDGSLTGIVGGKLRPNHPLNDHPSCETDASGTALTCDYEVSFLVITTGEHSRQSFTVRRSDGPQISYDPALSNVAPHYNKLTMIHSPEVDYQYEVSELDFKSNRSMNMLYVTRSIGDASPVVSVLSLKNAPNNCSPGSLSLSKGLKVNSLEAVHAAQKTAYFADANGFHFRLATDKRRYRITPGGAQGHTRLQIRCP